MREEINKYILEKSINDFIKFEDCTSTERFNLFGKINKLNNMRGF